MSIKQGVFNGVRWKSLTTVQQARATLLNWELRKYNQYRKSIELLPMGHADFLMHRYKMTLHEWLNKPICDRERLLLYKIKSKYFNNYPIA